MKFWCHTTPPPRFAPFGAFGAMAHTVGKYGIGTLGTGMDRDEPGERGRCIPIPGYPSSNAYKTNRISWGCTWTTG